MPERSDCSTCSHRLYGIPKGPYGDSTAVPTLEALPGWGVHVPLFPPVPIAQVVERPLQEREVAGSKPGRAIPKALKMVPVATLLGAQHYKASTTNTTNIAHKKKKKKKEKKLTPSTWFSGTRLMSPSGVKTYRKLDS